ncbi:MAG TPA: fasciclin domain-containing protein [Microthrixaceae bacterium]|nr:fasciclin domain-containing protein [Microthrixaceae bacterium]
MTKTRTSRLSAGLVALTMLLAACADDDSADSSDATETTTSDPAMADSGDAAPADDIVDTAVAAGDFTTLVAAVQAAGLEETLRGEGPFTVFAPTDDAFAKLPAGTVEALLQDPTGDLAAILTYHVVPGAAMAADVAGMDGEAVTTVNGATLTVNVGDDGSVSLTDAAGNTANVTSTDIETSNGVIHVIDSVLMPV